MKHELTQTQYRFSVIYEYTPSRKLPTYRSRHLDDRPLQLLQQSPHLHSLIIATLIIKPVLDIEHSAGYPVIGQSRPDKLFAQLI